MASYVRQSLIQPRPAPTLSALARWRAALFPTPGASFATVVFIAAFVYLILAFLGWAIVHAHWRGSSSDACPGDDGACWAFVVARWKPWLVGDYPADQLWRPWVCFASFAVFWAWVVRRSHQASMQRVLLAFIVLPLVYFFLLLGGVARFPYVEPTRWGGLLLTLVVTLTTFATALPLGLCLALGRRSALPVVRALCAGFVEAMRSVPLLVVLFIAATLLPMFLPAYFRIDLFTRAVVAFALFNAAMAAEVFRGGLQSIGRGQYEAAATVGLSDFAALRLIVLPQAVSVVVPSLVNIMIAVIKDTTVLSVIGVNDFLGAVEDGSKSPDWIGDANILTSGQVFLALAYLAICHGLSRYSWRLEAGR